MEEQTILEILEKAIKLDIDRRFDPMEIIENRADIFLTYVADVNDCIVKETHIRDFKFNDIDTISYIRFGINIGEKEIDFTISFKYNSKTESVEMISEYFKEQDIDLSEFIESENVDEDYLDLTKVPFYGILVNPDKIEEQLLDIIKYKGERPEIIYIRKRRGVGYSCDITTELDKHIVNKDDIFNNYIYEGVFGNNILIRYPGATRGCITVDDNSIIQDIKMHEETIHIYDDKVNDDMKKFIGKKVVFINKPKYKHSIFYTQIKSRN